MCSVPRRKKKLIVFPFFFALFDPQFYGKRNDYDAKVMVPLNMGLAVNQKKKQSFAIDYYYRQYFQNLIVIKR